jgi:hypothetical protein
MLLKQIIEQQQQIIRTQQRHSEQLARVELAQTALREQDLVDEQVFALLLEYLEPLGNFNARDVADATSEENMQPFRQAVLSALEAVNPRGGDTITPRRIGSLLGRVKGRAISGMCLKHLRDDHEGAVYYIMRTELAD